MVRRHELTDSQWQRLAPLLPPQKPATGRPSLDHRTLLNGILWRLKTGAPWQDLPERYGKWQTVYSRFRHWQRTGVWQRVLTTLQAEGNAAGDLDWTLHFVDSSVVRAHQHAAGAKRGSHTRWAGAKGASAPSSTSVPSGGASRWSLR